METVHKTITSSWSKSEKAKPTILYAVDNAKKVYVVAREKNQIVTLVVKYGDKIYTYVIPRVYLNVETTQTHQYYKLNNTSKLNIISCSNSQIDEMANFVAINIINKI